MAVFSDVSSIRYVGDGVSVSFEIPFDFFQASDIRVFLDGELQVSGFSISNGQVVFNDAPDNGADVFMRRVIHLTQPIEYPIADKFPSISHEQALDRLTYITQQLQRDSESSLKLPEAFDPSGFQPLPAPVAGRGLKWNSTEDGIVNSDADLDEIAANAQSSANAASSSESAAVSSALSASSSASSASNSASDAADARDKAQQWADNDEDVPVESDPDLFSAKHWAAKAEAFASGTAENISFDPAGLDVIAPGSDNVDLALRDLDEAIDELASDPYKTFPIGLPFPVLDHLDGVAGPDNSGNFKYIKLTANLTGAGEYNEGLLTNQSVSGSAPLVVATAEIVGGPLDGETVHLLNTENRYLMPGTSPGTVANDQMQNLIGEYDYVRTSGSSVSGAFGLVSAGTQGSAALSSTGESSTLRFRSEDSSGARTGNHTNVKHQQATYYMRIE